MRRSHSKDYKLKILKITLIVSIKPFSNIDFNCYRLIKNKKYIKTYTDIDYKTNRI